jgi:hypothetical protein
MHQQMMRMPMSLPAWLMLFGTAVTSAAVAAPQTIVSPSNRVSLLELYTSEGCSSCPPAEDWMSRLKDDPRLWNSLVPVNFHVDYWDDLGWHDPFDSHAYTERQTAIALHGGSGTIYTPGFALNGEEWSNWFNHRPLQLDAAPSGRLELVSTGREVRARYTPIAATSGTLQIHVVVLAFGVEVPVGAGENSGRRLHHDFLVVSYTQAPLAVGTLDFRTELSLPPPPSVHASRYALAAWVTEENSPTPLQAAGGWLVAAP